METFITLHLVMIYNFFYNILINELYSVFFGTFLIAIYITFVSTLKVGPVNYYSVCNPLLIYINK